MTHQMSTAVSFNGKLPAVRGAPLTKLLRHTVSKQTERVAYRSSPTREEEAHLTTLGTCIAVPEDVRPNFWELVGDAVASKDVDLLVRTVFLFNDSTLNVSRPYEEDVLDLTEGVAATNFADAVAATPKQTVVGAVPRPPLDTAPRKTLFDRILEFLASYPEGETQKNIAKGVKRGAHEVINALETMFMDERVQIVYEMNGKDHFILYRLPPAQSAP